MHLPAAPAFHRPVPVWAGTAFGNAADRDSVVTPPDRSNHHEGIAILVEDYKLDSARAAGFSWISALSRFVKSASVDDVEPVSPAASILTVVIAAAGASASIQRRGFGAIIHRGHS
jgi:hypothetical protein